MSPENVRFKAGTGNQNHFLIFYRRPAKNSSKHDIQSISTLRMNSNNLEKLKRYIPTRAQCFAALIKPSEKPIKASSKLQRK
jgi:hypothetical protein